ncbi:hypothetical protein QFC22_004707 [Naganishia vaughanmartiniae]|uniref:Uncharacterized protein n=1 Tax=Naganishia vaughanmartiniae TaxID=1424756 RepID=A0ACC2X001_9TREE|nr:hypothetical protein QFC22_004707 [Naganishia vaughanmartiniae]
MSVAKAAIDSARASGVRHIFYSSLAFGGVDSEPAFRAQVMLAHLSTEAYLRSLQEQDSQNFSYTVVRVGLYSESTDLYTASFDINNPPADGKIRIPHNGGGPGLSWAKKSELGEAVAKLIAVYQADPEYFPYKNKLMVLSGPRAYSLSETAKVFSNVIGREIVIEEVSVDEYAELPQVKVRDFFRLLFSLSFPHRLSRNKCILNFRKALPTAQAAGRSSGRRRSRVSDMVSLPSRRLICASCSAGSQSRLR